MKTIKPFLKWPGGKRWFVTAHADLLPKEFNRYFEPFLGGGSVFFHLEPAQAVLSDLNQELIETYAAIKANWTSVQDRLEMHQSRHSDDYYYSVRDQLPRLSSTTAARLIYLNRTCFNGIYRVNLQGRFNVPRGTKDTVILDTDNFEHAASLLNNADIVHSDFEPIIDQSQAGDFIFADPPYTVRHNVNGFLKYNEKLFSWDDQVRLADALSRARHRGVKIIATNANHASVRQLYSERGFILNAISRYSSISADPKKRKQFEELVISHPDD